MVTNIAIFKSEQFGQVRILNEHGKIYFCGKDVAEALHYVDSGKAIRQHCKKDGRAKRPVIDNIGRKQEMTFIDEGNLYRLITHSKLPEAEKFESWVFDKVLPTIRKTGTYTSNSIDDYKARTLAVKEQNAKIRTAQLMYKIADSTDTKYKQVLQARITQLLTGEYLLPLPQVDERTLSATEIGERLGITAHRVGMIANAHGLKTDKYGKYFYDKAKTADKQVETFRYYESSVEVFRRLLSVRAAV